MLQRFWSHLVDEAAATLVLHNFFRYGNRPLVQSSASAEFPGLFSGELDEFFRPEPQQVDLRAHCSQLGDYRNSTVELFRFPSPVNNPFPENNTVWAQHWRSKRGDGELTVVGVDGIVQIGDGWFRRLAGQLAPHGIDVVMMNAPYNHRRTPSGYRPGQLIISGNIDHQLAVARQAILDLWTVIVSLQREGRRVGLVGISFGGWMVLMASLLASKLEFVTALAPPVQLLQILTEGGTIVRAMRRGLRSGRLDLERVDRIARAVTPSCWRPLVDPARITLHAARYDRFVPPGRIEELARQWGAQFVMHDDGHVALSLAQRLVERVAADIRAREVVQRSAGSAARADLQAAALE